MKKILLAILFSVVLSAIPAVAADSTNSTKNTYKIILSVTYNAVDVEEMAKIVRESAIEHGTACKYKITVDKNALVSCDTISWTTGTIAVED